MHSLISGDTPRIKKQLYNLEDVLRFINTFSLPSWLVCKCENTEENTYIILLFTNG